MYNSVEVGTPGKILEILSRNSPEKDEEMPIKKTNLGIFLEESRNQIDPDALKLINFSSHESRRNGVNGALFPLNGQLV